MNKKDIWESSGKKAQDPFSQEIKERVDTNTRNRILNKLRWLGTHYRDPSITSKGTDSDTDSERESDTEEDSEEETGRNNIIEQTRNEEKRYNTSMRTATDTITTLEKQTKWLQEYKTNDQIANWPGYTLPYIPQTCKAAVASAFMIVLNELPTRDPDHPGSFSKGHWETAVNNAPRLSAAGGGGFRPDHLHGIIKDSPLVAKAMYGYHSYLAHGHKDNCTGSFSETLPHDGWAKTLLMLPRWLFHAVPSSKTAKGKAAVKINAEKNRQRVDDFRNGKWQKLDEECTTTVQCTGPDNNKRGCKKTKRKRDEQPGQSFEKYEEKKH